MAVKLLHSEGDVVKTIMEKELISSKLNQEFPGASHVYTAYTFMDKDITEEEITDILARGISCEQHLPTSISRNDIGRWEVTIEKNRGLYADAFVFEAYHLFNKVIAVVADWAWDDIGFEVEGAEYNYKAEISKEDENQYRVDVTINVEGHEEPVYTGTGGCSLAEAKKIIAEL